MQMTSDSHPVDNPDASETGPALTPEPQVMAELEAFVDLPREDPACCQTSPAAPGICPGSGSALHGPCWSLGRSRAPTLPKNRSMAPLLGGQNTPSCSSQLCLRGQILANAQSHLPGEGFQ